MGVELGKLCADGWERAGVDLRRVREVHVQRPKQMNPKPIGAISASNRLEIVHIRVTKELGDRNVTVTAVENEQLIINQIGRIEEHFPVGVRRAIGVSSLESEMPFVVFWARG